MKPPEEIFPKVKEAKFDESGRPYHFLFYTGAAQVYEIQYVSKILKVMNYIKFFHFSNLEPITSYFYCVAFFFRRQFRE